MEECPTWYTADLRVASEALRAVADRLVVVDVALGVGAAVTGVDTVPVEAGQGLETVVIGLTSNYHNR